MAARELIHFPLWAQLSPRRSLSAKTPFDPTSLVPLNLPRLYGCACTGAEISRCLWVTSRGCQ